MQRSAIALVTAALGLAACGSSGGAGDGGMCHSTDQSCATDGDCCKGFSCLRETCTFTAAGSTTGASSGTTGGSTGSTTTGSSGGGSSGGTSGGSGGCAAFGASCQSAPCCDPYGPDGGGYVCLYGKNCGVCEAQGDFCQLSSDCCTGLVCAAGSCALPSSCTAYAASCATLPCCSGLTCDSLSNLCYVSDGGACSGPQPQCATPLSCLSGVCGPPTNCTGYGDYCGTVGCCTGLTCDPTYDFCYVQDGYPCTGMLCAPPDSCLGADAGICGEPTDCSGYGISCATTACCNGLTCDSPSQQCGVAEGYPCSFGVDGGSTIEFCAPPNSCLQNGVCGTPVICGGYGSSGCSATDCCAGLTCDSSYQACYVAAGAVCTGLDTYCANAGTCLDSGVCSPPPTCSVYATACSTLPCCPGLTCDSTYLSCYVSLGAPCTGVDDFCADGNACLASGVCGAPTGCSAYGSSCGIAGCCGGLTCDSMFGVCYISPGFDCLDETCATPDSCVADVCQ